MYNTTAIEKVLTALYKENDLLVSPDYPLKVSDFVESKYKNIYAALYNLYINGNSNITKDDIIGYFKENKQVYDSFVKDGGLDILWKIDGQTDIPTNLDFNYTLIKKHSLLKELNSIGIDTTDIYDPNLSENDFKKQKAIFDAFSLDDILKHYEMKLNKLETSYNNIVNKTCMTAGEDLEELYKQLQSIPEVGAPLEGDIYNTITRGARKKKLFIDSGSSGSGKSRRMVGSAARLAIPVFFNTQTKQWEEGHGHSKVLYITTELEHSEIQTLVLAYVSGIDEDIILNNSYTDEERERIEMAIQYIEANDNIIIEFLPNPNFSSIQSIIKKHVLQDDVEYVFYDYIHISTGLTEGRDKQTRDDIILMLLSDTLKGLANELNIHISTATQLNGNIVDEGGIRNESMIRGARSIIDKADIGVITMRLTPGEYEIAKQVAIKKQIPIPNFVTDVYKNRRGKWTNVRIWRYVDLGTCRSTDCFLTDAANNVIDIATNKIIIKQSSHIGFVVEEEE